jgi:hypothetical protein
MMLTENTGFLCTAPTATALRMKIYLSVAVAMYLQCLFPTSGAMTADTSGMTLIFKIPERKSISRTIYFVKHGTHTK